MAALPSTPSAVAQGSSAALYVPEVVKRVNVSKCSEVVQEEKNREGNWIQRCAEGKAESSLGTRETVVDSGTAESVCPLNCATVFPRRRWRGSRG